MMVTSDARIKEEQHAVSGEGHQAGLWKEKLPPTSVGGVVVAFHCTIAVALEK